MNLIQYVKMSYLSICRDIIDKIKRDESIHDDDVADIPVAM